MKDKGAGREYYFLQQHYTTETYILPYLAKFRPITASSRVLEVACGEAGNLMAFVNLGCEVVGVDFNGDKIKKGEDFLKKHAKSSDNFKLITSDIYHLTTDDIGQFDIIILRDAIEHIPNQEKFMGFLRQFSKPDGHVFFGFPPWYMPFGGHQQGCKSILKKVPYFHILPMPIYKAILRLFKEPEGHIQSLVNNKETGITIERFRRAVKMNQWAVLDETLYLINPNYDTKFGLKPRKQFGFLAAIPFFRNFFTTCAYYIITPKN